MEANSSDGISIPIKIPDGSLRIEGYTGRKIPATVPALPDVRSTHRHTHTLERLGGADMAAYLPLSCETEDSIRCLSQAIRGG